MSHATIIRNISIKQKNKLAYNSSDNLTSLIASAFKQTAPFWPLKNLVAVNPLQGLEDLPIEDALRTAEAYFQQKQIPPEMEAVNIESIKWLQAYFDEGQATISMPFKTQGLYSAWRRLCIYDAKLHKNDNNLKNLLKTLPIEPEQAISECLMRLKIDKENYETFLTLLTTTLPGWSSYIKYRTEWAQTDSYQANPVTKQEYLALRIIITSILWPQSKKIITWHKNNYKSNSQCNNFLNTIKQNEQSYSFALLKNLSAQKINERATSDAQFVFCIDVRSEPFRKVLESIANYQTIGFAGFFGLPIQVTNNITNESHASCPVLLTPKHQVNMHPCSKENLPRHIKSQQLQNLYRKIYQALKYNFTTPFILAEGIGLFSGAWMGLRTLTPRFASRLNKILHTKSTTQLEVSTENISFEEQYRYAEAFLKITGLTSNFAPIIVLCGHGSTTQNNAFATALDCGACGGRHGANNAQALASILNRIEIRQNLENNGIKIPNNTIFIAGLHNTTTDELHLFNADNSSTISKLRLNLLKARDLNNRKRCQQLINSTDNDASVITSILAKDWAQVRPEWGLARNAAFIVAPRALTRQIDLQGRAFLHSYDYTQDPTGKSLTTILTAPMVVAQWINTQYLFSTYDNIAYGAGSKITKNITGKMAIMQGNASDLMTGLPLQSVYKNDFENFHELQRLLTIVYAPRELLEEVIKLQAVLKKLFGNGWVQLACIEPETRKIFMLKRDLSWQQL